MAKLPPNAVHPLSRAEWRFGLLENHVRAQGVWLVSFKKGKVQPRFEYEEVSVTARLASVNERANQWRRKGAA